jgi:plastocyanin
MRLIARVLAVGVLLILAAVSDVGRGGVGHTSVRAQAVQDSPRVVMVDASVPVSGGTPSLTDPYTGTWGFAPTHLYVTQGTPIEFDNPASNSFPHTVVSLSWSGSPTNRTLTSGMAFDSSPTNADFIKPGSSWTLDTSTLTPGLYVFYCSLHPWMTGSITVAAAP